MANRMPLNLGAPGGLQYGAGAVPQLPPGMRPSPKRVVLGEEDAPTRNPDATAMAAALGGTPTVESGSAWEAIAAALEGGIRGRAAWDERQVDLDERDRARDDRARTRKREEGADIARARALEAYMGAEGPDREQAMLGALAGGDRETAMSMALGGLNRDQARAEREAEAAAEAERFNRQNETTRRGQDLDYAAARARSSAGAAGAAGSASELSSRDAIRVGEAANSSTAAREGLGMLREFGALQRQERTGGITFSYPGSSDARRRMDQITRYLAPLQREPGSGSMSDPDREMYMRTVPNTGEAGTVNEAAIAAMEAVLQNRVDRAEFLDSYSAQNGSLQGVETMWNNYLSANPIFNEQTGLPRRNRPTWRQFMAGPAASLSADTRAPGRPNDVPAAEWGALTQQEQREYLEAQ